MDPSEMSRGSHARLGEDRELRPRSGVGMGGDAMRESLRDAPVYRPTRADMADFAAYVSRITPEVIAEYGICKIVPPQTWRGPPMRPPPATFQIRGAIQQHVAGDHGVYALMHQPKKNSVSFENFRRSANSYAVREGVAAKATLDELEDKFWSELVGAQPPLYGADLDASLFTPEMCEWNLNLLPDLLRRGPAQLRQKMAGINTPMLYIGGFRSIFSLHIEDMDLYSINYMYTHIPFPPAPASHAPRAPAPTRVL